jgi:hypothetical protein
MAKREQKYIRDLKKHWAQEKSKRTREFKKSKFEEVMAKEKVETVGDLCGIFFGLSRHAVENAAYRRIQELASIGLSPEKIIERMEPSKGKL